MRGAGSRPDGNKFKMDQRIGKAIHISQVSSFFGHKHPLFLRKIRKTEGFYRNFYIIEKLYLKKSKFQFYGAAIEIQSICRCKKLSTSDFYQKT